MRVKIHIGFFYGGLAVGILWLCWVSVTLNETNRTLFEVKSLVAPLRLQRAAEEPAKLESQALAKKILTQAFPIPQNVLEQTGKRFVDASAHEPNAWDVALDFVSYRSSRTISPPDVNVTTGPGDQVTLYYRAGRGVPGKVVPYVEMLTKAFGAANEPARWESIGENLNQEGRIPALLAKRGAVNLDGQDIRNVIFEGVEIHYSGKALILANIVFARCRFVMDNTEASRNLVEKILASSDAVNFQNRDDQICSYRGHPKVLVFYAMTM